MHINKIWSLASGAALLLTGCAMDFAGNSGQSSPATTKTISGAAYARDGDTVDVNGKSLDLWGIDAPNLDNADGWYARAALDDLIGKTGTLVCTIKDTSGSRDSAICSNSGAGDVGRAMLQGGWAIVTRRETMRNAADSTLARAYADAESAARRQRAGLWNGAPRR